MKGSQPDRGWGDDHWFLFIAFGSVPSRLTKVHRIWGSEWGENLAEMGSSRPVKVGSGVCWFGVDPLISLLSFSAIMH